MNYNLFSRDSAEEQNDEKDLTEKLLSETNAKDDSISITNCDSEDISNNNWSYINLMYYSVCFLLWITIWAIFIKLQFGTVYLLVSGLVGIYINTRTQPKKLGEVSAYSVFNKDCKSIDGTLKAEQFEREIRYGPTSVN